MTDLLECLGFETGLISSTLTETEFDAVSVGASGVLQASTTAKSRYALQAATGGSSVVSYGERDWGSDQATAYYELYVMFGAVPSAVTSFFSLYDSTPAAILDLRVNASGVFCLYNYGDTTTYTATNANGFCTVVANLWYRIELKLTCHASAGTIDVKINGVLEAGVSGLTSKNTRPGGDARRYRVGVTVAQANAPNRYIDDVIVRLSDWVGRGMVARLWPRGNDAQNWTVQDSGRYSYQVMSDAPWTNNLSDWIKSSTANQEERYTLSLLAQNLNSATILGVIPVIRHRRGVTGSAAAAVINMRSSGTDGATTSCDSGSTSLKTIRGACLDQDPHTAGAWGLSAINAMILRIVHDAGTNEADVNAAFVYVALILSTPASAEAGPSKGSSRVSGLGVRETRALYSRGEFVWRYVTRGRSRGGKSAGDKGY